MRGWFDGVDPNNRTARGWAFDEAHLLTRVTGTLSIDGVAQGTVTYDQPRPDVVDYFAKPENGGLQLPDPNHGLVWPIPVKYQDGQAHTITVVVPGLPTASASFALAAPPPPPVPTEPPLTSAELKKLRTVLGYFA